MKRLTELYTDLEIEIHNSEPEARHLEKGDFRPKNNALLSDCVQKLGQFEDIEDELGIDLITLFKALKDGIWMKKTNGFDEFFYHEKVASFSLYFKEIYVEHECEYQYPYSLKDYGKTWALTKEELL